MSANPLPAVISSVHAVAEYTIDALQRSVLFCDVLRQRSQDYYRHKAMNIPHVLGFGLEMILDARSFERPVNFWLARIEPPAGVIINPLKRPFVVFDPRAGQGPGIGGFKADSEDSVLLLRGRQYCSSAPGAGLDLRFIQLRRRHFRRRPNHRLRDSRKRWASGHLCFRQCCP